MGWRGWLGFPPANLEGFAQLAVRRLSRSRGETSTWWPEHAVLKVEGPEARLIALDRAFDAYCAAPRRRRLALLDRFLAPSPPVPSLEDARPNLLPAVRNRYRFANELRLAARHWTRAPARIPPIKQLAEHLGIALVLDEPSRVTLVGWEQLETWSLDFEEALSTALENLRARSEEAWTELSPGLFASPWSDFHDAARLCLADVFHRLPLRGAPVVAVPNRHIALATGDKDAVGLAAMSDATAALVERDRPISGIPVRHDGEAWVSFAPDLTFPSLAQWSELRAREVTEAYQLQQDLLQYEGGRAYVPVFTVPDGSATRTACVWPESEAPLLPAVDLVLLEPGPGPVEAIGQTKLREELPHLFERTDDWPPRWRALARPTAEELAHLELRQIDRAS